MGYWSNYPFHVFLILGNEFCERFSFYGLKAVLIFYLWEGLGINKPSATAIYHTFVVFCYLSSVPGASIADGWLGKFKTIFYLSIIYVIGCLCMTFSAIPLNDSFHIWLAFVSLFIIGFGTGGIKPCVSAFGGDQFQHDQVRQKESFFSLFYLTINIGSMLSTLIVPFVRGNVYCFGNKCYSLCFAIPAFLMITSIILFLIGSRSYTKNPPGVSVLSKVLCCIRVALGKKLSCRGERDQRVDHWLDRAQPEYDKHFIRDVKDVLRVAWLFLPLPVFWALFDQQGSKWAFQAQQMNGDFGWIVIYPDMIHFLNPLLVVILVPILEVFIYPCLSKLQIPCRPLQKMTLGMFLTALAFLVTGILQLIINKDQPIQLNPGETKLQVINSHFTPVNISLYSTDFHSNHNLTSLGSFSDYEYFESGNVEVVLKYENETKAFEFECQELTAYQLFINKNRQVFMYEQPKTTITEKSFSSTRFFNGLSHSSSLTLLMEGEKDVDPVFMGEVEPNHLSPFHLLMFGSYLTNYTDCQNSSEMLKIPIKAGNGPVTVLLLTQDDDKKIHLTHVIDVKGWSYNIFLQTPQVFLVTLGECLFSVTGLGFAYSQAPFSMKSLMTAIWLLTVCFGNILIILVQSASNILDSASEFFLFSGLMLINTIIFAVMSYFYVYVESREDKKNAEITEDMEALEAKVDTNL